MQINVDNCVLLVYWNLNSIHIERLGMSQNEKTDEAMEKGYAELAEDAEYMAEQELRRRTRGLSRYRRLETLPNEDEDGNEIPGMWSIIYTYGEPYESSHSSQIAIFKTLEEAQTYYDAYSAALEEGQRCSYGDYTYAYCEINFVPFAKATPVFHTLYTIDTYRSEDGKVRELETQTYRLYTEEKIQEIIAKGDDPHFIAAWKSRDEAFHAPYCDTARRIRKNESDVIPAMPMLPMDPPKPYNPNDDDDEYESRQETFITFNPKAMDQIGI
jgi:hypothetical protein